MNAPNFQFKLDVAKGNRSIDKVNLLIQLSHDVLSAAENKAAQIMHKLQLEKKSDLRNGFSRQTQP